jgi:D-beta-D-heptose 7-phosphate kinase/D-beta-D-heptose 1-phosphate adenosyltransferase
MITTANDCKIIRELCKGKVLVATAGTFDLLHVGHIRNLEHCRKLGDYLVVLMSSDTRVRQKKGPRRPIIPQEQRAEMLNALKVVDFVVIGFDTQPNTPDNRTVGNRAILEVIRPQIFIVKNPAWEQDRKTLKDWGIELRIEPEPPRRSSTTSIIATILDRYRNKTDKH